MAPMENALPAAEVLLPKSLKALVAMTPWMTAS